MESQAHIDLVKRTYAYIEKLVPEDKKCLIQTDSDGDNSSIRVIGGYIPDVYYNFNGKLFIGEAKTMNDFEREHSKKQFKAYIDECKSFEGEAQIVVSVPWQLVATAKNYFIRENRINGQNVSIVVVDETGRAFEI